MLYICATPIGNMEDITLRVLRILQEVDIIAAEDTRQTLKLLNKYDIKTPLTSYHEHNKEEKGPILAEKLLNGVNIALVSDAGMPGISDPGEDLVKLCIEKNIDFTVLPGATAAVNALVLSGFSTRSYVFEGFLPKNKKQRRAVLEKIEAEERSLVFYEAPHRLVDTLKEIAAYTKERKIAAVRELTKKHETILRATAEELADIFEKDAPKGEFVLVVEGKKREEKKEDPLTLYDSFISEGFGEKEAMKKAASLTDLGKREIYALILKRKEEKI
ncbi:MAG: 16S rRNA (cytidine(1402)-2'-O)-methyltransferase [Firmicutes bacterium]|nr:16S rRNA (cytidine(1402)-2'-O)-methyltransferase [Bacillota bacterium]